MNLCLQNMENFEDAWSRNNGCIQLFQHSNRWNDFKKSQDLN